MVKIFADTSGWGNFFVRTEPFHMLAKNQMKQWRAENVRMVTTNYTLTELVAIMLSPLQVQRTQLIRVIDTIKTAPWVEMIHIDPSIDNAAWNLLKDRPDKTWSLVDCASMIVMKNMGIQKTFTNDHHFEQAGFSITLKN
jgi:predicted nucleic acid-binding protein